MSEKKRGLSAFFGKLFQKKEEIETPEKEVSWEETMETTLEKNKAPKKPRDSKAYFKTMEEQMSEVFVQFQESKTEYAAVTSYLTDIQKIERMGEEEHTVAVDAAKRILVCTKERESLRGRVIRISKDQYQMAEQYEESMPMIIKNFKSNEESLIHIKNDMRLLEGEKGQLIYEREDLSRTQRTIKSTMIMVLVLVLSLFVLFGVIWFQTGIDMRVAIMIALVIAAASGSYSFLESTKNKRSLLLNEKKMNRAVSLLNMSKIKFVNYTSAVDYMKSKYHVTNSMEMNFIWTQYMKAKEEEKRYLRNSQMLELYHGVLTAQLKKVGLEDPEIWIYQPEALVDEREMVEIRHRLNERRGKMREQMEYNQGIIMSYGRELSELVKQEPEYQKQVTQLLKKFGV